MMNGIKKWRTLGVLLKISSFYLLICSIFTTIGSLSCSPDVKDCPIDLEQHNRYKIIKYTLVVSGKLASRTAIGYPLSAPFS